ncbi:MAG: hypothetical protein Q9211_002638 [Gyalolechia sp. 1 TL-2023]
MAMQVICMRAAWCRGFVRSSLCLAVGVSKQGKDVLREEASSIKSLCCIADAISTIQLSLRYDPGRPGMLDLAHLDSMDEHSSDNKQQWHVVEDSRTLNAAARLMRPAFNRLLSNLTFYFSPFCISGRQPADWLLQEDLPVCRE